MDYQRKDHPDPERPPRRNCCKQINTDNVPTDGVYNGKNANEAGYLLLVNKPRSIPR